MSKLDVILPAGGRVDDAFAAEAGTPFKAIMEVDGQTVLGRTIRALRGLSEVDRIVVIGPQEVQRHADAQLADLRIDEGKTGPENIFKGLDALSQHQARSQHRILIVTTDLPFLTTALLRSYIDHCPQDKDFTVPLISKREWAAKYPGAEATFIKLRDGEFTTGCAYLASSQGLRRARPHIEKVFENRKSKMGIARMLGPNFVLKWLTKKLTVADVERKVQALLDCSAVAVPDSPPELAFDIDYREDYRYARERAD